jgi:EpsI family protein
MEMQKISIRMIALILLMVISFDLGFILHPEKKMSLERQSLNFSEIIPLSFDDWTIDKSANTALIDPEVKEQLASVYSQTVSRTYVNSQQQRVMLSVAYGGDQEEVMQVHKPEVCYTAQGFTVKKNGVVPIDTDKGTVNALQLLTSQAERVEPVTYWITIGNTIALNGLAWRWQRIKYGLTGTLPDGLLFRVSSIGSDTNQQYQMQQQFIKTLINHLSSDNAKQILGTLKVN